MSITIDSNGNATSFEGNGIEVYRLAMLLSALKLQAKGIHMSRRMPAASSIAKRDYGLKGSVAKLIPQVEALLAQAKAQTAYVYEGAAPVDTAETV